MISRCHSSSLHSRHFSQQDRTNRDRESLILLWTVSSLRVIGVCLTDCTENFHSVFILYLVPTTWRLTLWHGAVPCWVGWLASEYFGIFGSKFLLESIENETCTSDINSTFYIDTVPLFSCPGTYSTGPNLRFRWGIIDTGPRSVKLEPRKEHKLFPQDEVSDQPKSFLRYIFFSGPPFLSSSPSPLSLPWSRLHFKVEVFEVVP